MNLTEARSLLVSIFNRSDATKTKAQALHIVLERLDALDRWKKEMLAVEAQWSLQRVGEILGVPVGHDVRPQIEPAIRQMQARITELEKALGAQSKLEATYAKQDAEREKT